MSTSIAITCRFFGRYAEAVGVEVTTVTMPTGATVQQAVDRIRAEVPGADGLPGSPLAAVNRSHVFGTHVLENGDEVALLPPLAGG